MTTSSKKTTKPTTALGHKISKPRAQFKPDPTDVIANWNTRRWPLKPRGSAAPGRSMIEACAFTDQATTEQFPRLSAKREGTIHDKLAEAQMSAQAARDAWKALFATPDELVRMKQQGTPIQAVSIVRPISPAESVYMEREGSLPNAGLPLPVELSYEDRDAAWARIQAKQAAERERYAAAVKRDRRLSSDKHYQQDVDKAHALNINEAYMACCYNQSAENMADLMEQISKYAQRLHRKHWDMPSLISAAQELAWRALPGTNHAEPLVYDPKLSRFSTWIRHLIGYAALGQYRDRKAEREVYEGSGAELDLIKDHTRGRKTPIPIDDERRKLGHDHMQDLWHREAQIN